MYSELHNVSVQCGCNHLPCIVRGDQRVLFEPSQGDRQFAECFGNQRDRFAYFNGLRFEFGSEMGLFWREQKLIIG